MKCPMCGYILDAFDKECPRCHGRGLQPAQTAQAPQTQAPSQQTASLPAMPPSPQPSLLNIKVTPFVAGLLIILVVSIFGYRYWTRSPQYSLRQAQKAASAHDFGVFEKYVDVDGGVESYIDDMLAEATAQQQSVQSSDNVWQKAGEQFAQGLMAMMKPTLVSVIKKEIRDYIETGDVEKAHEEQHSGVTVEEVKKKVREQGVEFDGIEYVKKDGSIAFVGLQFTNRQDKSKSFTIELKMRWMGGYWQVSKWSNAVEVLKKFGIEEDPPTAANSQSPQAGSSTSTDTSEPVPQPRITAPSPTADEIRYYSFVGEATDDLRNEVQNLDPAIAAYAAGDVTNFRTATLEARTKMQQDLAELNGMVVPARFNQTNIYLRQGLSLAEKGFSDWVNYSVSESDVELHAGTSKLKSANSVLGQAMKERDRVRRSFP